MADSGCLGGNMKKFKYAIEMGGSYTCIYVNGEGLALKEPTLIAAEPTEDGYKVIAMGQDAKKLVGKTKENVEIFTPMPYMEHSNYEYSVILLKYFLMLKYIRHNRIEIIIAYAIFIKSPYHQTLSA